MNLSDFCNANSAHKTRMMGLVGLPEVKVMVLEVSPSGSLHISPVAMQLILPVQHGANIAQPPPATNYHFNHSASVRWRKTSKIRTTALTVPLYQIAM